MKPLRIKELSHQILSSVCDFECSSKLFFPSVCLLHTTEKVINKYMPGPLYYMTKDVSTQKDALWTCFGTLMTRKTKCSTALNLKKDEMFHSLELELVSWNFSLSQGPVVAPPSKRPVCHSLKRGVFHRKSLYPAKNIIIPPWTLELLPPIESLSGLQPHASQARLLSCSKESNTTQRRLSSPECSETVFLQNVPLDYTVSWRSSQRSSLAIFLDLSSV